MALISVDELNEFTGNYETASYKTTLVGAASDVVEAYLGYSVATASRMFDVKSWGADRILLPVPHATSVENVSINGEVIAATEYTLAAGRIHSTLVFSSAVSRGAQVYVEYTAGYEEIPDAIKLSTLRIAALMLEEADGNIGVTGKTFADMSKQFISYTNYDKYLRPISGYRLGAL